MEVSIDNRSGQELPIASVEELANYVIKQGDLLEDLSDEQRELLELSISFVTIDEMTELNSEYRGKSEPTDVLSFEMDDDILLGDIVINPDVARKHAVLDELNLEEEIWALVIHGILHLIGYDHMNAEEATIMEELEDKLLNDWFDKMELK